MTESNRNHFSPVARTILVGGALVLLILGLKSMAFFWNTAFLAIVITITLAPVASWLKKKGLPGGLATGLTILMLLMGVVLIVLLLLYSADQLLESMPEYRDAIAQQLAASDSWFAQQLDTSGLTESAARLNESTSQAITEELNNLGELLSIIGLAVVASIFMLFEAANFSKRFAGKFGSNQQLLDNLTGFMESTRSFIAVTTLLGITQGTIIAIGLYFIGVPYPIIWGVLFWLLNYIPYLGIWLSVIPPTILAWATLGSTYALLVLVLYGVVSNVFKLFILPKVMGDKIDTSMTVGFLGIFFWGWVLGVIGMLLAYPYTLFVRDVLLTTTQETWLVDLMKKGEVKSEEDSDRPNLAQ
jgi:predicted PurR-regulated permease PerM